MDFPIINERTFLGIGLGQYGVALFCVAAGFVLRAILLISLRWLLNKSTRTKTTIDDIIIGASSAPLGALAVVLGIWAAVAVLPVPSEPLDIDRFVQTLFRAATIGIVFWWLIRLNDRIGLRAHEKALASDSPLADFAPLARRSLRVFLAIIGLLLIVQELGYSVTSLVAGLGLGGLAVGLAAKDTLANFFGSVVIFVDRPFARGDWIVVGDQEGVVEDIGVRVTRLRTFANSLITIPNAQLTTSAITNWSRMGKRRIDTTIGITYDTPPAKVEAAIRAVEQIILSDDRLHHDFFMVKLTDLADYSLNIRIYCFTVTIAWAEHLTVRQELLLKIMRAFAELGISFAFPTQTVHAQVNLTPPGAARDD